MENKIKTLYTLSIIAVITFLGMQAYWLYSRYEYSLQEYENRTALVVNDILVEYNKIRTRVQSCPKEVTRFQSFYNMKHGVDSEGQVSREATVTTYSFQGRKLLGITEDRKLTEAELDKLASLVLDSIDAVSERKASLDVSSAPTDGVAWEAMRNFDLEIQSPFTVEGIDSLLIKSNISADVSLIITDSLVWKPITRVHESLVSPRFQIVSPYSELEFKAVMIDCQIPTTEIIREMCWTLVLAFIVSVFLIVCLISQIKTIVKLSRLDNMRNSFITTMIHELKRPISTLKMCVAGIESDRLMEDDSLRHELTGEIRIALDNLSAYFTKLRDITFNNVEQIPLNVSSFYLFQLVDNVTRSIVLPSSKNVLYINDVPLDLEISADRSHFINILTNIIENSIKYSGDDVTVKIEAEVSSDGYHIKVTDNGNGISQADKRKIYDRFYRGEASSSDIPGMGLGLAYVKLLIEAHGGAISVESEEGVGSTFTIILPQ